MTPDHFVALHLLAITNNGTVISNSSPNYAQLVLGALLSATLAVTLFLAQGERERRRQVDAEKEKNHEQMAAVNQSLALLLEKQGDTTKDLTDQAAQIRGLQEKGSAYETSLALLKQAIDIHITSSEEDRRVLHQKIDATRAGLREFGPPTNRRSVERD